MERRTKRSEESAEALQYLVEALADRSDVDAVLLMSDAGRIVAGMGKPTKVSGLSKISLPVMRGQEVPEFEHATSGTDFFGRKISLKSSDYYLTALGSRLSRMHEAVYGVARILEPA